LRVTFNRIQLIPPKLTSVSQDQKVEYVVLCHSGNKENFPQELGRLQPTAEVYHRSLTQADKADIAQTHSHAWIRVMLAAPLLSMLSLSYLGKFV